MQARERGLLGIVCALLAATALGAPASAEATVRFASPAGAGPPSTCTTQVTACTLHRAVVDVAVNGDEVVVLPGTYAEADELIVSGGKYVHAAAGAAAPNLIFPAQGVRVSGGSVLERLLTVTTGPAPDAACSVEGSALLRDSACWASAANGIGLSALADGQVVSATLRNVTIEATSSPGRGLLANADNGGTLGLDVKNTISRGTAPGADVEASALDGTSSAAVVLERSNFATKSEVPLGGVQSITNPGTNSNQTAFPALANRAGGNFHQLAGSPTVDAGASFSQLGSSDLDSDPRTIEGSVGCIAGIARPDIGADELVPPSLDCVSPETAIVKGPKRKTRKRRASFEFSSTEVGGFQCSLDQRAFSPCATPQRYRKLRRGKHVVTVRAIDLAGNLDTSPAERTWTIRAKKKRKRRARK